MGHKRNGNKLSSGDCIAPVSKGDVSLFKVELANEPCRGWQSILDTRERQRGNAFRLRRDSARYINAHVALRQILSIQTGVSAPSLAIAEGEFGKPRLNGASPIEFSLSHSQSLAVIACSKDAALGVDVEIPRDIIGVDDLASALLTKSELSEFIAVPAEMRAFTLLTAWTRKEAILKAVGLGLQVEPRRIEAGCNPTDSSVCVPLATGKDIFVNVRTTEMTQDAIISVATVSKLRVVHCRNWDFTSGD